LLTNILIQKIIEVLSTSNRWQETLRAKCRMDRARFYRQMTDSACS